MDASYITPFIDATKSVFSTMLKMNVTVGQPGLSESRVSTYDISGIIGLSGDVIGSVVLTFPTDTALKIIESFVGSAVSVESDDFTDAVGELVNMISGAAKAQFEGKCVSISCPSVVVGENHRVQQPRDATGITIPCTASSGEFSVEVFIKETDAAAGAASAAAKSAA